MNTFITSDLTLATTLCVLGYRMTLGQDNGRQKTFVFDDNFDGHLQTCVKEYWNKDLRLEPQQFAQERNRIQSMIKNN